jgi:predicted ATPase/DNA-binding SARP family transcriptional activator
VTADGSGHPPLALRFLGACEVTVHGRPLPPLRYRKELWLLALLALRHDREVARDGLAALFWPDAEESQALYYLRRSLSNLRRALGSEARRLLTPTPRTVRLDLSGAYCDLLACDAALAQAAASTAPEEPLQQAISLHRGPFLPDCLEEWALTERNQREQSHFAALERLAQITREKGDPAAAVRWLRLLVAADPYRESAACALLQALADSGDRAAMQQVYQELRLRLRNDLNAAPAPETEALYQRLNRRGAHPPSGLSAPPVPAPGARPPKRASGAPRVRGPHLPPSQRHLPVPLTDLIGREQEIEEVVGHLGHCRLVTLFGAGGVGKTRLAIAVAERVLPRFPDGVWFIDLAPLTEASLVAEATAMALGLREEEGRSPEERLTEALTARGLLLVLDNCEHVLDTCAALCYHLLSTCPGLRVLATSRHVLRVEGEQVYPVPSLALPPAEVMDARRGLSGAEKDAASLLEYEGIRLFVQRAVQASPTFKLDRRSGAAVAEICRHLDGIPLAIEMAAARVRSLSVSEINTRLSDRFRLLTRGNRAALPRQQTLRSALDWSYDLLNAEERDLLRRLAVFAGGCTLEGAAAVIRQGDADACLEPLASLVDKSLVVYEDGEYPRYRMLETVREYAREKLDGSGEWRAVRNQHRDWYLQLAEQAEGQMRGSGQEATLVACLEAALDNFRAVLAWCEEEADAHPDSAAAEAGLRLATALFWFWMNRGYLTESLQWLEGALARGGQLPPGLRASALMRAAHLAYARGDRDRSITFHKAARREYEKALALARATGDRREIAWTLLSMADATDDDGDQDATWSLCVEARPLFEELDEPVGLAEALRWLASVAMKRGDRRAARPLLEERLAICRKLGESDSLIHTLGGLGHLERDEGDYARARAYYQESLLLRQKLGHQFALAQSLEDFAVLAGCERRAERAIHLLGAGEAFCETLGARPPVAVAEEYERTVAEGRAVLGEAAFAAVWAEGRAMSLEQAVEYALEHDRGE